MLRLPEIDSLERRPDGLRLRFRVHASLEYFAGHFSEVPLLPGVVQVGWAVELARLHLAPADEALARFRALGQVKFMRVIQPGAQICLDLELDRERRALQFAFGDGEAEFSRGRVLFH